MPSDDASEKERPAKTIEWILAMVLVSVLLALSFIAWKRKSDRAGCIINIRNVQQAIRGWEGMHNLAPGSAPTKWPEIVGPGGFINPKPTCPAGGTYRFREMSPKLGELAMECSLCDAPENHKPDSIVDW